MSFNLSKETPKFNLTKDVPSSKFRVAIKWDKNNIKSLYALYVDLMAICGTKKTNNMLYDIQNLCCYKKLRVHNKALLLSRDDRSGDKGEEIDIDFSLLPENVHEVLIFITFFSNRADKNHIFNNLSDFNLLVTDLKNDNIVVTSKDVNLSGVTHEIIKFVKVDNQWDVELVNKSLGELNYETYTKNLDNNIPMERFDYYQLPKKGFFSRLADLLDL